MDADLTLAEAAAILNPPMTVTQLVMITAALRLPHTGARRNGHAGRPRRTYPAAELMALHKALLPWLAADTLRPGPVSVQ